MLPCNPQDGLGAEVGGSIPINGQFSLFPPFSVNTLTVAGDIVRQIAIGSVRSPDCRQVPSLGADCSLKGAVAGDSATVECVCECVHSDVVWNCVRGIIPAMPIYRNETGRQCAPWP
jgi:hypothetical protein